MTVRLIPNICWNTCLQGLFRTYGGGWNTWLLDLFPTHVGTHDFLDFFRTYVEQMTSRPFPNICWDTWHQDFFQAYVRRHAWLLDFLINTDHICKNIQLLYFIDFFPHICVGINTWLLNKCLLTSSEQMSEYMTSRLPNICFNIWLQNIYAFFDLYSNHHCDEYNQWHVLQFWLSV